ncbi:hypothetical protein DSO57_1002693 [Entomophthora muscae]|uniref:Uncharacterized protein n=1 Tax=Entomophthora muscae TaxID=34485 RepID=A0ACC2UIU3_9FUNG|nr:hypothetical protein DSO57_1002693 [Entomophthora muscae]
MSKTKVQESKTKYKEPKIFLEDSKYWQTHIVSLTPPGHIPEENDNPFQLVPGYDPEHTLGTGGQELSGIQSVGVPGNLRADSLRARQGGPNTRLELTLQYKITICPGEPKVLWQVP